MYGKHEPDRLSAGVLGYVDGVPVKVGEKFRPPARIALPVNYQNKKALPAIDDYDFELERKVLAMEELRRKTNTDNVAAQIEQFTRVSVTPTMDESGVTRSRNSSFRGHNKPSSNATEGDGEDFSGEDKSNSSSSPSSDAPVKLPNSSGATTAFLANIGGMLQPLPPNATQKTNIPSANNFQAKYSSANGIKLEDFESESSPFDSMELKTLNDMEELRSVLQCVSPNTTQSNGDHANLEKVSSNLLGYNSGVAVSLQDGRASPRVGKPEVIPLLNGTIQYFPSGAHLNGVTTSGNVGGYSTSNLPSASCNHQNPEAVDSLSQSFPPPSGMVLPFHSGQNYAMYFSSAAGRQCTTTWNDSAMPAALVYYSQASTKTEYVVSPSSASGATAVAAYLSSGSPSPQNSNPQTQFNGYGSGGSDSGGSSNGSLRNARSTPDLLKELGRSARDDSTERKRHSRGGEIPRPSSVVPALDSSLSNSFNPDHFGRRFRTNRSEPPQQAELTDEAQSLMQHIVDMGFSQPRVARAIQKLGVDDKKVVEHLCSLQTLIEKGYDADRAEAALFIHNQDELVATEHLALLKQFLDLGFEEEAVKRALILNKNNRDKALDYLVS